jgi:hypothetical protein
MDRTINRIRTLGRQPEDFCQPGDVVGGEAPAREFLRADANDDLSVDRPGVDVDPGVHQPLAELIAGGSPVRGNEQDVRPTRLPIRLDEREPFLLESRGQPSAVGHHGPGVGFPVRLELEERHEVGQGAARVLGGDEGGTDRIRELTPPRLVPEEDQAFVRPGEALVGVSLENVTAFTERVLELATGDETERVGAVVDDVARSPMVSRIWGTGSGRSGMPWSSSTMRPGRARQARW